MRPKGVPSANESVKRIAIFLPSLDGGGAERAMVGLANGLNAAGEPVDLVLARAKGPYLAEVSSGIRIIDLQSDRALSALLPLVRYFRRERPRIMMAVMTHVALVAIVARMLARVAVPLLVSERISLAGTRSLTRSWSSWIMSKGVQTLYPRADRIVAVSEALADELRAALKVAPGKVQVLYNPVISPGFDELGDQPADHPWFQETTAIPVIFAAGRLHAQKGFDTLIEAFARVHRIRRARLLILGEGTDRAALVRMAEDLDVAGDVDFPGFAVNPFPAMKRANLVVLSSRFEGLPNVLIQAMACGIPVVATNCPTGPGEILENGKWGRLVPVDDVAEMAAAISASLSAQDHPDVQSRAAYFSRDAAVAQFLFITADVLRERAHHA